MEIPIMEKFYLIFLNVDRNLVILEKDKLTDIYDFIIEKRMVEGSYRLIKGMKVI
jgi:hypothetical protein